LTRPAAAPLKFASPQIDEATIAAVGDVLRSGQITSGAWVERFEAALSAFCDGRPVRVLTSATAAVEVALQLCGIGPGDEVITCGQSFFTVLNMIVRQRATPVFVDCDLVTRNIELGPGLDAEPARGISREADWIARWRALPQAYALMAPDTREALAAAGVPMRVVVSDTRRVLVARK
jgi:hypothetical protein